MKSLHRIIFELSSNAIFPSTFLIEKFSPENAERRIVRSRFLLNQFPYLFFQNAPNNAYFGNPENRVFLFEIISELPSNAIFPCTFLIGSFPPKNAKRRTVRSQLLLDQFPYLVLQNARNAYFSDPENQASIWNNN